MKKSKPELEDTSSLLPATGLAKQIDATFTNAPRSFLGERLWSFTEGERTLWHSIRRDGDSSTFAALLLLSLLRDLEREHAKQIALNRPRDLALELATADFLAATEDVNRYRARVIGWNRSLTPAQSLEAEDLALKIIKEGADTALIPTDEGTAAGN